MKMSKKALSAAITMSLVLGVYGVAGAADNLYGSMNKDSTVENVTNNSSTVGVNKTSERISSVTDASTKDANYTVTGGEWNEVYGGYTTGENFTGEVSGNLVTITGGTIDEVCGAYLEKKGAEDASVNVTGNTVKITGGEVVSVVGGEAQHGEGSLSGNSVIITGGTITRSVIGGAGSDADGPIENNTVEITGGTFSEDGIGIVGGSTGTYNKSLKNNTVKISNVDMSGAGDQIYGAFAAYIKAEGNTVILKNATVSGAGSQVYGGLSRLLNSTGNTITIANGGVTGERSSVFGGMSMYLSATDNIINLGGYLDKDKGIVTDKDWKATIAGTLTGGYIDYNDIVSRVEMYKRAMGMDVSIESTGNTLNVFSVGNSVGNIMVSEVEGKGKLNDFMQSLNFYIPATAKTGDTMLSVGGAVNMSLTAMDKIDATGLIINTDTSSYTPGANVTLISFAKDISNAEKAVYQVNGVAVAEDKTAIIDVNSNLGITNLQATVAYDITTDTKKISFGTLGCALKADAAVTDDVNLGTSLDMKGYTMSLYKTLSVPSLKNVGDLNFYISSIAGNGYTLLTVNGSEKVDLSNSNVKAGVQSGSALVAGNKINLIATTAGITAPKSTGMLAEAGYTDYKLNIAVEDTNLVATVAKGEDDKPDTKPSENAKSPLETMAAGLSMLNLGGDMLAGAGLESAVHAAKFGEASGDIFAAVGGNKSKIKTGSHVDLKGVTMNLGFAKEIANKSGKLIIGPVVEYGHGTYDSYLDNGYHGEGNSKYWGLGVIAKQLNNSGMYYEGSLRGGKVENDYSASKGGYDADAKYIAAHLGLGKIAKLNDKNNIDVYAKYFLTHQSGSDAVNATNTFDFSCATSNRTRLGARYNHSFTEKNSIYAGLAWQYEFSGETKGTIDGNSVEAPSIKGHTGILELGWKANPTKNFDISIGMNGYTGVERGVGANLKLTWKF